MMRKQSPFPDRHQNFWQLTCIQGVAQSIPGILIGGVLAKQYSPSIAITSICIGNLILWIIGLSVVLMAAKERKNAIENIKTYIGKWGTTLIALIFIIAFLTWFATEVRVTIQSLSPLMHSNSTSIKTLTGAFLGVCVSLLSLGGIILIKRMCCVCFPILLVCILLSLFGVSQPIINSWDFSFRAILTIIALFLPGMVNLPTFFRHSHSKTDSILALTLITLFQILFVTSTVLTGIADPVEIFTKYYAHSDFTLPTLCALIAIMTSSFCLNTVNIYYASAGLEEILPSFTGYKGYLTIGLLGTALFAFIQEPAIMQSIETLTSNLISNFGIILIISLLVSLLVKHRLRTLEKSINLLCWLMGSLIGLIIQMHFPNEPDKAWIGGIYGSIFSYLIIIFLEETIWATKKVSNLI